MLKSVIAVITALAGIVCSSLSGAAEALVFPNAPATESVEFAARLSNGWNLGNTLDACKKGCGVVLSEFGWTDRTNLENLAEKAGFFVSTANKFGISCLVWDNGGDFSLLNRNTLSWDYPGYACAITKKN